MTNNTLSRRKEINSAVGSWAGFIYQGLCGVYHVLSLLLQNGELYKDYKLSLDSYEDFAILDEHDKLVSLHQCKDIKGKVDYTDECQKMAAKMENFKNNDLLSSYGCKMYLHSNLLPILSDNVEGYVYNDGAKFCQATDIMNKTKDIITKVLINSPTESAADAKFYRLVSYVYTQVLEIQKEYHESKEGIRLYQIARNKTILFSKIQALISEKEFHICSKEVWDFIKMRYILQLKKNLNDDITLTCEIKPSVIKVINDVSNTFCKMETDGFSQLMQRIHPDINVSDDIETILGIANPDRIQNLYIILRELTDISTEKLNWVQDGHPSSVAAFHEDEYSISICCQKIYNNAANLDILYIYDWLVGRVSNKVHDIKESAKLINYVPQNRYEQPSIFEQKVIGILNINDKKNSNYD